MTKEELVERINETPMMGMSIRKAAPQETEKDATNGIQWFRPNGGELWFLEVDSSIVRQLILDVVNELLPSYVDEETERARGHNDVLDGIMTRKEALFGAKHD